METARIESVAELSHPPQQQIAFTRQGETMKLPYAKGIPLSAALLILLLCGGSAFAASERDGAVVQESGDGATGITLTEKK
jgi:hypothetical protein